MNSNHGQISIGIIADKAGVAAAAIGERDFQPGGAVHDVAVREDESIGREDESRAAAGARESSSVDTLLHVDLDDRRADLLCRGNDRA